MTREAAAIETARFRITAAAIADADEPEGRDHHLGRPVAHLAQERRRRRRLGGERERRLPGSTGTDALLCRRRGLFDDGRVDRIGAVRSGACGARHQQQTDAHDPGTDVRWGGAGRGGRIAAQDREGSCLVNGACLGRRRGCRRLRYRASWHEGVHMFDALLLEKDDAGFRASVRPLEETRLPAGDVLLRVEH